MKTTTHRELAAAILRLTRAEIRLSQPERVAELLSGRKPDEIIQDNLDFLYAEQDHADSEVGNWLNRGFNICTIQDSDYPHLLKEVHQAPALLYWQGTASPTEVGVSVIGSRRPSPGQRQAAFDLAAKLADAGIPVISGLAEGIDTAAHNGALSVQGRTVAIMGTGLMHTYPSANRPLRGKIVQSGGLILTQFEPHAGPTKKSFPMRNEVMSGYGVASIVMAATEKSGTKHQVRAAVRHGRSVIFTGRVANNVSWAHKLVEQGRAYVAGSLSEAVDLAKEEIQRRNAEIGLFE